MTIFRSDYTIRSLAGGATSQQFTNTDYREKADPTLSRPLSGPRLFAYQDVLIMSGGSIDIVLGATGNLSQWPPAARNVALDIILNDTPTPIYIEMGVSLEGNWLNKCIVSTPIVITVTPLGSFPSSVTIIASSINITLGFKTVDVLLESLKVTWVKWSNIGSLDFTIGRDNIAGERPLDWNGWIYEIKKLGDKVVTYGENGVSFLTPSSRQYGLKTISRIGLHSAGAVTGNEDVHYYIDKIGQLWRVGESLELLDYSEFFSAMGSLVMSYDTKNEIIYICDGVHGYIYSIRDKSLGTGPVDITGVGTKDGTLYVTSVATIVTPTFELCTDIYDMGTRKFKTVKSIEVGTDLTENMQASIDYRVSNKVAFSSLGWVPVTLEGISYLYCYGLEFRFKLRVQTYEYFELDYLKINGQIHNYSFTEHTLHSINEQRGIQNDS